MKTLAAVTLLLACACSTGLPTEAPQSVPRPVQLGTYWYYEFVGSRQSTREYWTIMADGNYEIRREDRVLLSVGSFVYSSDVKDEVTFRSGPVEEYGGISTTQVILQRASSGYNCKKSVTLCYASNWFAGGQPTCGTQDVTCTFQYKGP